MMIIYQLFQIICNVGIKNIFGNLNLSVPIIWVEDNFNKNPPK
jgi:hypothetical protein